MEANIICFMVKLVCLKFFYKYGGRRIKSMSNVKIYTVDDEEPNCNRCDHVCDSDIVCQQYCGNEHYWNGYSRTEFIEDGE